MPFVSGTFSGGAFSIGYLRFWTKPAGSGICVNLRRSLGCARDGVCGSKLRALPVLRGIRGCYLCASVVPLMADHFLCVLRVLCGEISFFGWFAASEDMLTRAQAWHPERFHAWAFELTISSVPSEPS